MNEQTMPALNPEASAVAAPAEALSGLEETSPGQTTRQRRGLVWVGVGIAVLGLGGLALLWAPGPLRSDPAHAGSGASASAPATNDEATAISVNSIRPHRKTLVRTLEQPGSLEPWAEAELHAKASGYLKWVAREYTPQLGAELWAQGLSAVSLLPPEVPAIPVFQFAVGAQLALEQAPEKDLGSSVTAGELLLAIDVPELVQDVAQKESLLEQSKAELEQALKNLDTFEAAIQTSRAQQKQAEADVRRFESEHAFQVKQLNRFRELAQNRTITEEVVDEKQNQVNAAKAAWESSQQKVQVAQADLLVVSSKLAAARAEILVKETRVRVARDDFHRAQILAGYAHLRAPFNGTISSRDVDEGDFIQNASTGQTRRLMTVTASERVKVVLQVPEREALWVQVGAEATVSVDARTNWEVKGRVARVSLALDRQLRTRRIEIDLENSEHKLLPGMYGQVTLLLQKIENVQAIPATTVYSRKGENYILQVHDGIVRRQRVRIRYDDGKELEVVKLMDGQEIPLDGTEELIVSNKGEISDGQRVRTTRISSP